MELIQLSIREQMYNIVKERILNNEYKGGQTLNIVALCKEFGISNTPVREALFALEKEGFLISNFNYKYQVFQLTTENMEMINQALAVLLCGAYRCVINQQQSDHLIQLLSAAIKRQKKIKKENLKEYINASIAFDKCFVEATGNAHLVKMFDMQTGFMILSVRYTYGTSQYSIDENLLEHEKILEAVQNKDIEKVVELIKTHYEKDYKDA
ncbi:GntR family transcriptional regulator [Ihubacter sp. rT4E-8]|uniref:GntR family transcriptional regulator n=1 Tax=Ihubacter sp. rT4E-8 TaxID=3242369 RepID=UPI003CE880DC